VTPTWYSCGHRVSIGPVNTRKAEYPMVSTFPLRRRDCGNTSDIPQPFSSALGDRHADHERIRDALQAGDQETARAEMENHIVGTVEVIRA